MTKEEILAMEAGKTLDCIVLIEIFDEAVVRIEDVLDYSTDISAAWQVVDKFCNWDVDDNMLILKGQGPSLEPECEEDKVGWWEAEINGDWGKVIAEGKIAPEAICKAALLAKLGVGDAR